MQFLIRIALLLVHRVFDVAAVYDASAARITLVTIFCPIWALNKLPGMCLLSFSYLESANGP
jgi:hypothetical protein